MSKPFSTTTLVAAVAAALTGTAAAWAVDSTTPNASPAALSAEPLNAPSSYIIRFAEPGV
jgi:hypothetical protein